MIATQLAATTTGLDVWHLVMDAGPMAKLVLLILLGFSVASWGIMAERFRRFRRAETENRGFLRRFQKGGGLAAIQDVDVHEWFESLCHEGMPHHVIVLPGHHADLLRRFARLMRVGWCSVAS